MQEIDKSIKFKKALGEVLKEIREQNLNISLNKVANEYDFDKGTLSKIERGYYNIQLITAWKLVEVYDIKFSHFAKRLEDKLGEDFSFIDE